MNYALFLIVPPEPTGQPRDERMQQFLALAHRLATIKTRNEDVVQLHPDLWQIPLHSGLAFLAACVSETNSCESASYRVVFLPEKPDWIETSTPKLS